MRLAERLVQHKKAILEQCISLTLQAFPQETARFLCNEADPFVNPFGQTLRRELGQIFDGLVSGKNMKELETSLDAIVRIQAVQELSPSRALGFLGMLKRSIQEHVAREKLPSDLVADLHDLEARLDTLLFLAFDLYVECRAKISEIRIHEARKERDRLVRLLQALTPNPGS